MLSPVLATLPATVVVSALAALSSEASWFAISPSVSSAAGALLTRLATAALTVDVTLAAVWYPDGLLAA